MQDDDSVKARLMTNNPDVPRKAEYGFDAGYLMPIAGIVCFALVVLAAISRSRVLLIEACAALFFVGFGLHTSRRGKFLVWEELLDGLYLKGDERILDLGCGRGAVLLSAAKRLSTGHAVGVDIWSRVDQSGNSASALLRNAAAEKVSDRIAPVTANMMALPFESDTFDLVVSSVAIHNIKNQTGRATAIDE